MMTTYVWHGFCSYCTKKQVFIRFQHYHLSMCIHTFLFLPPDFFVLDVAGAFIWNYLPFGMPLRGAGLADGTT